MRVPEPVLRLAGTWGIPDDGAVAAIETPRIAACRWVHELPEFEDAALPLATLVLLLEPSVSIRRRGGRLERASDKRWGLGLMPAGSYGAWDFKSAIDVLHVYMPEAVLTAAAEASVSARAPQLHDRVQLDDPLLRNLALEINSAMQGGERSALYVDTLGAALAARVVQGYSDGAPRPPAVTGGLAPWMARRAIEYLVGNLKKDVSLQELADTVDLSTFHFARQFKRSVGMPPHAYLRRLRCEKAMELLVSTETPVTEVAAQVGYETPQAFARMFRAETGVTPSDYRRHRRS